jgi:hypothetical protein
MPRSRAGGRSRVLRVEIEQRFRAPLPFVFRWCTDYTPEDPRIEKERYVRRILSRGASAVTYEDLGDHGRGWFLNRQVVTLYPPDHWHAESDGNYRSWSIDYTLRSGPDGSTVLRFRGTRRATPLDEAPPTLAAMQRNLRTMWSRFARALERDHRRGAGR